MGSANTQRLMQRSAVNGTTTGGKETLIGDQAGNALLMLEYGADPSDSEAGAAKGCLCLRTDAGTFFINTGTAASSTWKAVTQAA